MWRAVLLPLEEALLDILDRRCGEGRGGGGIELSLVAIVDIRSFSPQCLGIESNLELGKEMIFFRTFNTRMISSVRQEARVALPSYSRRFGSGNKPRVDQQHEQCVLLPSDLHQVGNGRR